MAAAAANVSQPVEGVAKSALIEDEVVTEEEKQARAAAVVMLRAALDAEPPIEELKGVDFKALSDHTLTRFVVARNLDINAAKDMLIFWLKWRVQTDPERITPESCISHMKMNKAWLRGRDNKGRPVIWVRNGRHDGYNKLRDEGRRYIAHVMTSAEKLMDEAKGVTQFVVVMDYEGYGWANYDINHIKDAIFALDRCFPERLAKAYLINTSWVFWCAWKIVSPFIPARTRAKITFLGSSEQVSDILSKVVPSKWIPRRYGGEDAFEYEYKDGVDLIVFDGAW